VEERSTSEFSARSIGVLVASMAALALGPTGLVFTTFSLFLQPIGAELGWDRATTASLLSMLALGFAAGSPIKGYLFDRWGVRAVVLPLTVACGVATAGVSLLDGRAWRLQALFAFIGLVTPGNVAFGKVIAEWFRRQRGMAYGILGVGVSLGIPAGLQLGRWLIDVLGWRETYAIYGALEIVTVIPLLYWFLVERPPAPGSTPQTSGSVEAPGLSLGAACASSPFWLIILNMVLCVGVLTGLLAHGVAILTDRGFSREAAATISSALALGILASQPLLGYLLDRFDTPRIILPFAVAAFAGLALFLNLSGFTPLLVAMAIIGLGLSESATTQYLVTRYFGLRNFSLIYGCTQPFLGLASAAGPYALGLLYDRTGSYRIDLLVMVFALLGAAGALLFLRPYPQSLEPQTRGPGLQTTPACAGSGMTTGSGG
jgi:MFS family permease